MSNFLVIKLDTNRVGPGAMVRGVPTPSWARPQLPNVGQRPPRSLSGNSICALKLDTMDKVYGQKTLAIPPILSIQMLFSDRLLERSEILDTQNLLMNLAKNIVRLIVGIADALIPLGAGHANTPDRER